MSKLTKKQIELITEYIKKGEGSDDDLYDFLTENKIPVKAANRYIYTRLLYVLKNAKAVLLLGYTLQCTLALAVQESPDTLKICTRRQNEQYCLF